ncbi:MAG: type II secretion system protein N [Desulforhopalus sp.]|jgi:type II secretion system protein N
MIRLTPSSRFFLYVIYGLLLTTVLLYVRFPTDTFKSFCEQRLEQSLKASDCSIKRIHYSFPVSVVFEKVHVITSSGEQKSAFTIDQFKFRPGIKFWQKFKMFGDLYSGTFRATLALDTDKKSYQLTDIVLNNLNLNTILKDQGVVDRKATGTLGGSGRYSAEWDTPAAGEGKGRIEVKTGQIEFLQPILSLTAINFNRINLDISVGEQVEIQQGKLKGKNLNADFEGSLDVMDSLLASRVRLSGLLEPKREFLQSHPKEAKMVKQYAKRYKKSALPFKLRGTVANPTFRFSR